MHLRTIEEVPWLIGMTSGIDAIRIARNVAMAGRIVASPSARAMKCAHGLVMRKPSGGVDSTSKNAENETAAGAETCSWIRPKQRC